jgi:hypothetical protein
MTVDEYWKRRYHMEAIEGVDALNVDKSPGTDWCWVRMTVADNEPIGINLRSKEMAEQLHFMLGQMLGK